ncbi:C40 family peptidase [Cellulophaga sp. 20_2_10]|uniref:C40 family peptidase n=1 Tax=Cellulophaga sp. 20_2_10 TaxID=2942476 RepID=UPI00201AE56E|nr:SH3 domain-containing C40 family peptidase [Cellulophaga sp. 20_2_10]MCL5247269.1 C40 family peptidase [Cellulophaga sp. 20_2_10]
MMKYINSKIPFIALVAVLILGSCKNEVVIKDNPVLEYVAKVKQEYAPDKRVALFNIESKATDKQYVLTGESNLPKAVNELKTKLNDAKIEYIDSIQLLPTAEFKNSNWAIVKISVANLRSKAGHSQELATQATLGTPVKVFKSDGDWYLIQTPDNYLAWVDKGGIEILKNDDLKTWKTAKKIIYTDITGFSYTSTTRQETVSDLVAGSILELVADEGSFYQVKYPDGRLAFVKKEEAQTYNSWLAALNPTEESLVATSKQLMGLPYLWGGTSSKGVDCSGFTKTIYFLNGMVLPRDASQQVHAGAIIDKDKDFSKLAVGDLLFFGRQATDSTKQRVVHVGMWIGNNQFIHSSGRVHISSMDKEAINFDEFNLNRYLQSNRMLHQNTEAILKLKKAKLFMD